MLIRCFPTYITDWREQFNQGIVPDPERAYRPSGIRADRHSSRTPPVPLTCRWWGGPPASRWSIPSFPVEQYNAKLHYAQNPSGGNLERRAFKTEQLCHTKKKVVKQCARWEAGGNREAERQEGRDTETRRGLKSWKQGCRNISQICDLWPCCCFLLLFYPHRFQFYWARDESNVCPFLHQPTNPPVIVVFLHDSKIHLQWLKRYAADVDCISWKMSLCL